MSKILRKIRDNQSKASIGEVTTRVYAVIEKEIRESLQSEIRAEVQNELSALKAQLAEAKAETVRVKGETKAEIARTKADLKSKTTAYEAASKDVDKLRDKISGMETSLIGKSSARVELEKSMDKMTLDMSKSLVELRKRVEQQDSESLEQAMEKSRLESLIKLAAQDLKTERERMTRAHFSEREELVEQLKAEKKRVATVPEPPPPSMVHVPAEIPDFMVSDVMRGPNDRIIGATIKPVRSD